MARPLRINYPGVFYHVASRGNERKNVFKSKRDREKFFEYLGLVLKSAVKVVFLLIILIVIIIEEPWNRTKGV